jgi:phosphoglucosamine mutase
VHFGTDGIRGRADVDVTESVAYKLGYAVATVFPDNVCFVGCDTRDSSDRLAAAALVGVHDGHGSAINLGVITTPGVAVVAARRNGVGIVVSASHNPYYDNGLKVLGVGGSKLDVETEQRVESALNDAPDSVGPFISEPVDESGCDLYLDALRSSLAEDALHGLSLVLDCANGAASTLAPALFRSLGAEVTVINAEPDGTNINADCGSTHPAGLVAAVRRTGADLGLAFDGDADRLIAVDENGVERDGDDLMVLFARDLHEREQLGGVLVVTQMSNLGLHRSMAGVGIDVIETEVGDRAVLMALEERDLTFGGEQSGHLIFRTVSPAGDGMLTGLLLGELLQRCGSLASLTPQAWQRLPQHLLNVPTDKFRDDAVDDTLRDLVVQFDVGESDYRLLVRPSGTEPVVRVMIEALDAEFVATFVARVAERCGLSS